MWPTNGSVFFLELHIFGRRKTNISETLHQHWVSHLLREKNVHDMFGVKLKCQIGHRKETEEHFRCYKCDILVVFHSGKIRHRFPIGLAWSVYLWSFDCLQRYWETNKQKKKKKKKKRERESKGTRRRDKSAKVFPERSGSRACEKTPKF